MSCPLCGSSEYPHSHDLGRILNSRVYCADGERHTHIIRRRWFRKRQWCTRCQEWKR